MVQTYNQEDLITRCLESVLSQRFAGELELIVVDDGSTDGTAQTIQDLVAGSEATVRLIRHSRNRGAIPSFIAGHNATTGEFVAHLDGDDYWLPGKLGRQLSLMQAHPEVGISWHNSMAELPSGRMFVYPTCSRSGLLDLGDFVRLGVPGVHSSCMYRRELRKKMGEGDFSFDGSQAFSILSVSRGYCLAETLSVYRVGAGIATTYSEVWREKYLELIESGIDAGVVHPSDAFAAASIEALAGFLNRRPLAGRWARLAADNYGGASFRKTATAFMRRFEFQSAIRKGYAGSGSAP